MSVPLAPPDTFRQGEFTDLSVAESAGGALRIRNKKIATLTDDGAPLYARYTWYEPGVDTLALTGEECDAILDAVGSYVPSMYYGGTCGLLDDELGPAIHERIARVFVAADTTWWHLPITKLSNFAVNTYGPGDRLPWHTDGGPLTPGFQMGLVCYLSEPDEYEGGRLEFHHDDKITQLGDQSRGKIVTYPATLLHRVTTVTSGRRTVLIAFAEQARHDPPGSYSNNKVR